MRAARVLPVVCCHKTRKQSLFYVGHGNVVSKHKVGRGVGETQ